MANTRQARAHTGGRIAAGVIVTLLSLFCFLCAVGAFGSVGKAVSGFLVGFFGLAVYGYSLAGVILGVALTFGIRVRMRFARLLFYVGLLVLGINALQIYSSSANIVDASYGDYLLACYYNTNTAGGMLYGVAAYPLMKVVTSVGALIIACVAFFVLAFFAILPVLRKNTVPYTASSSKQRRSKAASEEGRERPVRTRSKSKETHRIRATDAPVITDFSQMETQGENSLYVVDVAGDPMPQKRGFRRIKGAEGYRPINSFDPLYPNKNGGYEDEIIAPPVQNTVPRAYVDAYTSRGLARDILFGDNPSEEVLSRYQTANNPQSALSNVAPSYDAVRRGEMRNRFSAEAGADGAREEFIRRHRVMSDESAVNAENANTSNGNGTYGGAKLDFYALKAERERTFAENPIQMEDVQPAPKREVVEPTRVIKHPDIGDAINPTIRKAENAVNTGMLGALNRVSSADGAQTEVVTNEVYETPAVQQPPVVIAAQNNANAYIPEQQASNTIPALQPAQSIPATSKPVDQSSETSFTFTSNIPEVEKSGVTPVRDTMPRAFAGTDINNVQPEAVRTETARNNTASSANNMGYELKKPDFSRPAYVDTNPTQGGDMPSEPLPVKQPITSGAMSRTAIQGATDIVKQSGKEKESAEMAARIENVKQAIKETPKISKFEAEAVNEAKLREEKMKSAKNRGVIDEQDSKPAAKKKERLVQVKMEHIEQPAPPPRRPYVAPPLSLLAPPQPEADQDEDYELKKERIVKTLNFFNIKSEVDEIKVGPTFTLYKLKVEMPRGKTVSSICAYENDIAMKMEVKSVRILAPIPGQNAVGIEVPNKKRSIVTLSEIIQSPEFNACADPASFAIGKNLEGEFCVATIKDLPHVLVAGTTGAGKSCCINSLIVSLLYKASPDDVRLILVDPKRVEMSVYAGIPHLLMDEIICDTDKAIRALNWALQEMDRRMKYFAETGYRDIESYNADVNNHGLGKMARIVIIIDEFADLMATGKKAVEDSVNRIASLARAAGIHMVLATQRPSTDIISGTIKNNLPSRIAFKVASGYDSKTILDTVGAEKLLGLGDLMYSSSKNPELRRMQGAYISNDEVRKISSFVKEHNDSFFDETVKDAIFKEELPGDDEKKHGNDSNDSGISEDLYRALKLGIEVRGNNNNPLSISNIQRRLGFGYPKAAKMFDKMMDMGFLTDDGSGKKKYYVNISFEELERLKDGDTEDGEFEDD